MYKKRIISIVTLLSVMISLILPATKIWAAGSDLTNDITINNVQYSHINDKQSSNLEVLQAAFDFSGDWDATALGENIQPNDYFVVPFKSKDEKVTLSDGVYDLKDESGRVLGSLKASKADSTLTFTFNNNITGLTNVKGTFRVNAAVRLVRGTNEITYPDGTTQTVLFTDVTSVDIPETPDYVGTSVQKKVSKNITSNGAPSELLQKFKNGEISVEEYLRELSKYSSAKLYYQVRVNYQGEDYKDNYVVVRDRIGLDSGSVLTYDKNSVQLSEITLVDNIETEVKSITITTDQEEFENSNGEKALLIFSNGGTAFDLHLGNAVGNKSYKLIYSTDVPKEGTGVTNNAYLTAYVFKDISYKEMTNVVPDENVKSQDSVIYTEQSAGGTIEGELSRVLRITKYDATDATKLLPNATFKLTKLSDGSWEQIITTNEEGIVSVNLEVGEYIVTEVSAPNGYQIDVTPKTVTIEEGKITYLAVANNPIDENELISIPVTKIWDDANNQDGFRWNKVTVELLKNGRVIQTQNLTGSSTEERWYGIFENLPKYENGKEIVYTIRENFDGLGYWVDDHNYTAIVDGYTITNKHTPMTFTARAYKQWEDEDDKYEDRPETVIMRLRRNGQVIETIELSQANNWQGQFGIYPLYENGEKIDYSVTEDSIERYTSRWWTEHDVYVDSPLENTDQPFYFVNTYIPEFIQVSGMKIWEDDNNKDGKRPEKIIVNLLANGEVIQSKEVSANDNWVYIFDNLPKYKQRKEIVYTVSEESVDGYKTTVNGYNIINQYIPTPPPVTEESTTSTTTESTTEESTTSTTTELTTEESTTSITTELTTEESTTSTTIKSTIEESTTSTTTGEPNSKQGNDSNELPQTGDSSAVMAVLAGMSILFCVVWLMIYDN